MNSSHSMHFKLRPPVGRAPLVDRESLIEQVESFARSKLVLVTAPAGYGKTVFLSQWYEARRAKGLLSAWLNLERADRGRVRFIQSMLLALRSIQPSVGDYTQQLLEAQAEPDVDNILDNLCDDFQCLNAPTVIFIDEYDSAASPGINSLVETLLRRTPNDVSFTIAARRRPNLPTARLRLQNQLHEVSAEHLCFTMDQATRFLNEFHSLHLDMDQIEFLLQKTEGWVAGLQLVMLALRARTNSVGTVVKALSGEFRDITDYLAADVLEMQAEPVQDFLLKTSVLTRFNAELCEELTGRAGCQELLEQLESANLFITPIDDTRRWYRYHQLFREFLLGQLRRRSTLEEGALFARASQWFRANGFADEGVQCALFAGDNERAAMLVERSAEEMIRHGQVRQVIDWINKLPQTLAHSRIQLCMIQCWAMFHSGRIEQGYMALARAQELVAAGGIDGDAGARERFTIECRTVTACLASSAEDEAAIRKLCADPASPEPDLPFLSGTEVIGLGTGCYTIGEFDRANEFAEQAEALFRNTESPYGLVMSHCLRAIVLLGRAQLGSAMQHLQRAEVCALADSGAYSYCCALARALQGVVRYLRFDLEGARQLLNHNLPLIVGCGWVEIWRLAAIFRARVFSAERMWSQAEESLRQSVSEQQGHWVRRSLPLVRDESVRILIQAGDLDAARNYAVSAGISLAVPLRPPERWEREKCLALRAQARLFLAEGQPGQALECVRSLRPLARASGRELRDLELAILEAVALRATGDVSGAMRRLAAAVNVAANDGIVAPFVEEGPMCLALLHELEKDARGSAIRAFLRQLTLAFGLAGITRDDNRAAVRPSSQLTKREVEVLEMLADGAENREISGQLGISEFTVKWHVRNILEKFGASNRRKAVLTARKQGYLP